MCDGTLLKTSITIFGLIVETKKKARYVKSYERNVLRTKVKNVRINMMVVVVLIKTRNVRISGLNGAVLIKIRYVRINEAVRVS